MIAAKAMTYGTRRLLPGDEVRLPRRDADLLERLGRLRQPGPAAPVETKEDELTVVRRRYEEVMGKRAYHAWDVDELRKRMAQAKD